jgi:hypothetical protein
MRAAIGSPCGLAPPATASFVIGACVMTSVDRQIPQELGLREEQVTATVALLDGGATGAPR